jgi:hypothetical protein
MRILRQGLSRLMPILPTPLNRIQTPGQPDTSVGAPPQSTVLSGASRALENSIPFVDRAVAGAQSVLPEGYGGTGQDYAANLDTERAKNAQFEQQNPWTSTVGGIAASAPLVALEGPSFGLGGLSGRMASSAVPIGLAGALQGASNAPDLTNVTDTAERTGIGGAEGAALGAAAPLAAAGIGKVISPFAVSPERQALVEGLNQAGINPTAGQVTGNKTLSKLEAAASDIPFGGGGAEVPSETNSRAFTAALMEKAGAPRGQIATPENLNALHESLGDQFDALGARNSITIDPQLRAEIGGAVSGYHDVTGTPAPGVAKTAEGILGDDEAIPGDKYNTVSRHKHFVSRTRRRLRPIAICRTRSTAAWSGRSPRRRKAVSHLLPARRKLAISSRHGAMLWDWQRPDPRQCRIRLAIICFISKKLVTNCKPPQDRSGFSASRTNMEEITAL